MNLTEIRTKLVQSSQDKLRAYATITLDQALVIRDLKVIEGSKGPFVAMPSRKLQARCSMCSTKNHVRARYCNECGHRLHGRDSANAQRGRLYADIAHPIHQAGRNEIQAQVLSAYLSELARSREDGYVAQSFEDLDYDDLAGE